MRYLVCLAICGLMVSVSSSEDQAQNAKQSLIGEWQVTSIRIFEGFAPSDQVAKVKLIISKDELRFVPGFELKKEEKGELFGKRERKVTLIFKGQAAEIIGYSVDFTKTPATIDLFDPKKKDEVGPGLVEIDGNKLRIFTDAEQRPQSLDAPGSKKAVKFEAKRIVPN